MVQVAEEAGVPAPVGTGISEVVDDGAAVRVQPLEAVEHGLGAVGGDRQLPQRVVAGVEQLGHGRQSRKLGEDGEQVVALGVGGVLGEVDAEAVSGLLQAALLAAGGGTGEQRRVEQAVVFEKAHEHAGQYPGRRRLGDPGLAPGDEVLRGALRGLGAGVFIAQMGVADGVGLGVGEDVLLQPGQQGLQVGEQVLGVDHGVGVLGESVLDV